jgi:hypothetical protein
MLVQLQIWPEREFLSAAWRYINTPSLFLFDLATSVPFSYYDYIVYKVSLLESFWKDSAIEKLISGYMKQNVILTSFRQRWAFVFYRSNVAQSVMLF